MADDNEKKFSPGEILCREGEQGSEAFLIQSGRVRITTRRNNDDVVLAELGPGELVGEFSLIDREPRSATAMALTTTHVLAIRGSRLDSLFKRSPELATSIVKLLVHKLRETNLRHTSESSINDWRFWRKTLYLLLLLAAARSDAQENEVRLAHRETCENFAIGLGITAEQANKVVGRLLAADVLYSHPLANRESYLSMLVPDTNTFYNYIERTFSPGAAEPLPTMNAEVCDVAANLLGLCRKHYGNLSAAVSTFKRDALVEFISRSDVHSEQSEGMRKRLIAGALDELQKLELLTPQEGEKNVVLIDLNQMQERVEEDLYLVNCRNRYQILSRPWGTSV